MLIMIIVPGEIFAQKYSKGASPQEAKLIEDVVSRYHRGFIQNDPEMVLSSLGNEFIMFNGNYSGDSTRWEAHLFRTGDDLKRWPARFLEQAGPYQNTFEFLHLDVRNSAALVVTKETGKNRFRSWRNEVVTWLLGKRNGEWKIVGFFIKDIKNPN
jgi:hypothetical protein